MIIHLSVTDSFTVDSPMEEVYWVTKFLKNNIDQYVTISCCCIKKCFLKPPAGVVSMSQGTEIEGIRRS